MAIYKENIVDIDLEKGQIHRAFLNHSIGMYDQKADRFGIKVFRDGEPVDLTGVAVQGVFMPPQGSPIAITGSTYTSIDGNTAEVILPQACYNYEGTFTLAIKLVDSGNSVTGTMRIVDGMVDNTHASGTVAPTGAVPTYQEVLAVYDQAIAAIEDVNDLKSALNVDNTMIGIIPFWSPDTNNAATSASPAVGNVGNLYTIDGSRTNTSASYVDFSDTSRKTNAQQPSAYIELKAGHTYIMKYEPIAKNNIANERIHLRDRANNEKIADAYEGEEQLVTISEDTTASFMFIIPGSTTYSNYKFRVWLLDITGYNLMNKFMKEKDEIYKTLENTNGLVNYWGNKPIFVRLSGESVSISQNSNRIRLDGTAATKVYFAISEGETRNASSKSGLSRTLQIKEGHIYRILTKVYSSGTQSVPVKLYDGTRDLISINTGENGEWFASEDATAVLCLGIETGKELSAFDIEVDLVDIDAAKNQYWAGKKVAWFGDSLSYGSVLANPQNAFPYKTANALGMTIYNHAVGGSVIAKHEGDYDEIVFSLDEFETMEKDNSKKYLVLDDPTNSHPYRIYSFVNNEWTPTSSYTSTANGRYPIVDVVKCTEADADMIVIATAMNDFMYHWTPFGDMDSRDDTTFYGALHKLCNYLQTEHGDKEIVFVKVLSSRYQLTGNINADWSCTTPDSVNPIGKTIGDYRKAIDDVCLYYSIPCIDLGGEIGFAQFQHPSLYYEFPSSTDNLHWNATGHKRAASVIVPIMKNLRGIIE